MSATLTFDNGAMGRIYGSLTGALSLLGSETTEWDDVTTDESLQRLLVRASRYLDKLPWQDDYDTFAERDALDLGTGDGDAAFPFRAASYRLANAALLDESLMSFSTSDADVSSMSAGGTSISLRNVQSEAQSAIARLPEDVLVLVGRYLDYGGATGMGGTGVTGSECNPFASDQSGRLEPD